MLLLHQNCCCITFLLTMLPLASACTPCLAQRPQHDFPSHLPYNHCVIDCQEHSSCSIYLHSRAQSGFKSMQMSQSHSSADCRITTLYVQCCQAYSHPGNTALLLVQRSHGMLS